MAYDADLDATFNPSVGGTPTAAYMDKINGNVAHVGGAWASYTPAWTCSGTAPALGNGTLTGAYLQVGKTLYVRIQFTAGTTTTFGTGDFRFSLPNSLTGVSGAVQTTSGYINDGGTLYVITGISVGTAAYLIAANNGGGQPVHVGTLTWGNGDALYLTGVIQVT